MYLKEVLDVYKTDNLIIFVDHGDLIHVALLENGKNLAHQLLFMGDLGL